MTVTRPRWSVVDRRADVGNESARVVAGLGMIRLAESTPRESDDVELVGEQRREVVERVGRVAQPREKENRRGPGRTAEVQVVKPDARRDAHHAARVMRRVAPRVATGARLRAATGARAAPSATALSANAAATRTTERPCPTTALW